VGVVRDYVSFGITSDPLQRFHAKDLLLEDRFFYEFDLNHDLLLGLLSAGHYYVPTERRCLTERNE